MANTKVAAVKAFFEKFTDAFDMGDSLKEMKSFLNTYIEELERVPEKKPKKKSSKKPSNEEGTSSDDSSTKKREPNFYNLFLKEHMADFKDLPGKERMAAIGKFWRESEKGKFFCEQTKALKKDNPELSNEEVYAQVADMYNNMSESEDPDEGDEAEEVEDA